MRNSSQESARPETAAEVGALVRAAGSPVLARGGGSKSALSSLPSTAPVTVIETGELAGITEYQPSEYTVTALAGTKIGDLEAALQAEGQFLPFDPLLSEAGATVGGTIASGTSGPGRLLYGGVRDFLLGVVVVDGAGEPVRGGGKVVKNAAGFDLPKLMVGSLGRYGVLVEATFKVFPRPEASGTLEIELEDLGSALDLASRLLGSPLELASLDLEPVGGSRNLRVSIRLSGTAAALSARLESLEQRIEKILGRRMKALSLRAGDDNELWRARRELQWAPSESSVVKIPLTLREIPPLEALLAPQRAEKAAARIYSGGGQLLLLAWPGPPDELTPLLAAAGLSGLVLRLGARWGGLESPRLAPPAAAEAFERRVRSAMDPEGRFASF